MGKLIRAGKPLSLAEEYLQDHFPAFPVLPGVLMIEAMVQSSAWLVRISEDFRHSMVLLKEARNVSYGSFVSPGDTLEITNRSYIIKDGEIVVAGTREEVMQNEIAREVYLGDSFEI